MEELFEKMAEALIAGKQDEVKKLSQDALDKGIAAKQILDKGLLAGMDVVGKRFKAGDMFIPEVLLCARCMHGAMDILKPLLSESDAAGAGTYVIGTVEGDLHDIGKNLVSMMLEGAGFKVMDLGVDLNVDKLIDQVKALQPDILGLSALLTTTMPEMQKVIGELKAQGLRDKVKVLVGGAPVDRAFAEKIGADGYGANATEAVELARRFAGAKA